MTHRYTRRRGLDDPPRRARRAAVRRHGGAHRRPVAVHAGQPRARRGPGLLHQRRSSCPTAPRSSAPTRSYARSRRQIRANPANLDVVAFAGFDFIGGGFRNNAATIFVTQNPWDERQVTAAQLVGELFDRTMGIKEALVLAFNPPAIFGLGTAGGYEFYIQNRGEGGAKRLQEMTRVPRAREPGSEARRRADALARDRAAALRRRRPREGEDARRARSTRCSARSRPRSAPITSTTSTSTAAPGRC